MTVSAGEAKAGPYTGNDVTSSFAFAFKVFADDDIRVVETLIATEVESDLVLNTDYTVSRNADQDADPGGTITYKVGGVTTALPSTKKLTIVGDFDYSQPTDIPNGGSFFANVIETALDRLMMQIKQIKEQVGRAVLVDVSSDTLPSALMDSLADNVAASAASATAADASADAAAASALAAAASEAATSDKVSRTGDTMTGLLSLAASTDIASAATVDLSAATGNVTRITGTTAVSAWTMNVGQWHMVIADGALPLTYHATTNKLNTGGAPYTCSAGDRILLHKDDDNIVQATIFPASGQPVIPNLTEGTWTDYSASSTIVGWSSFTTKQLYYKDIGKTRFVYFKFDGTSNSTTTSFTLPSASSNTVDYGGPVRTDNNGITGLGHYVLPANSATVAAYYGVTAAAWTASGTKRLLGQFNYQLP